MIGDVVLGRAARAWFAATAAAVLVALAIQIPLTAGEVDDAFFGTAWERVLNLFVYFTIWSNILVAVVCARLALGRDVDALGWRVARLAGLVAITVTFAVYNLVLRGLLELSPLARVADEVFHTVVPLLTVVGWVVFGPRRRTSWAVVAWSFLMPVIWVGFTLVRGPLIGGFYPYPFLDVDVLGWGRVLVNVALVAVLFGLLAAAAHAVDVVLGRRSRAT